MSNQPDGAHLTGIAVVTKFDGKDFERYQEIERRLREGRGLEGAELHEAVLEACRRDGISWEEASSHNALVTVGQAIILDALIGVGITAYTNANAALGVGDSSTAFALGQTNLQGAASPTNRIRKAMNATYPSRAGNVVTFQSTFATTEANFAWQEWGVFNSATDGAGTMLNRAVSSLGSKTSASAWTLTSAITLA